MSKQYKIAAVSPKQQHWQSQYGEFTTYFVRLEGEGDEAVQINKKADSKAPEPGDEIYGEITSTQHGLKFKSERKPQSGGYQKTPEDKEDIARAVALKASVELFAETKDSVAEVLETADTFLSWLKGEKPSTEAPEQSKSLNTGVPGNAPIGQEDVEFQEKLARSFGDEGEKIDIESIPF